MEKGSRRGKIGRKEGTSKDAVRMKRKFLGYLELVRGRKRKMKMKERRKM